MDHFLEEVLQDLSEQPKRLNSKYFYDEAGDKLFQQIMNCADYYPTNCELEIFQQKTTELANVLKNGFNDFDLVEMGAGDATKSSFLLKELVSQGVNFTYMPIDISSSMIDHLALKMPEQIPGLKVLGLNGEYFQMLEHANKISTKKKVILFLGGNIGNFELDEAHTFCKKLKRYLNPGDLMLIGFDLKKHPQVILSAYNDRDGYTREFNLNLLRRINRELGGDFNLEQFEHFPSYDPATGSCRSYLISLVDQKVRIVDREIAFKENEYIDMEVSQKYSVEETEEMAEQCGFMPIKHFFDEKGWFLDTVWQVK